MKYSKKRSVLGAFAGHTRKILPTPKTNFYHIASGAVGLYLYQPHDNHTFNILTNDSNKTHGPAPRPAPGNVGM